MDYGRKSRKFSGFVKYYRCMNEKEIESTREITFTSKHGQR